MAIPGNLDPDELARFESLGTDWWAPGGSLRTLHAINPVRLAYVADRVELPGAQVLDAGCGGGILSESLARRGARVTGLDASPAAIAAARRHAGDGGLHIDYVEATVESHAAETDMRFDVITCMELLEHVPDPASLIAGCAALLKPGGDLFLSTINRTPQAYAAAILGAEYLLRLLPRGTHRYRQFLRPSELSRLLRSHGFVVADVSGVRYLPWLNRCLLAGRPSVNYLVHARWAP